MSRVAGIDVVGVAGVGSNKERCGWKVISKGGFTTILGKHTVNTIVGGRVADDRVAATKREVILTVDLVLATVDGRRAGPDIDVRLAVLPISGFETS